MNKLSLLFFLKFIIAQTSFDGFLGTWKGEGKLFKKDARFTMIWTKVLNNNFYQLQFENVQIEKKINLTANAFYKQISQDSISGVWFDSRGTLLPLKATFRDNTLEVFWGSTQTEQGKTVYKKSNGSIIVTDYFLRNAEYYEFGNAIYEFESDE